MSPATRASGAFAALVLIALTFAVQANSLGAWFVGDDFDFLTMLGDLDGPLDVASFAFWGEWEPLWHLSWFVDQRLWGLNPVGFHLTNTAWLAVCVIALFALGRAVWPDARAAAWAAALLFLVHPLHDEAVVYLAARGHPMALGLALLALTAWVHARRAASAPSRRGWLAAALTLAFLAGLAKETALTLPAWVLALEWLLAPTRGRAALGRAARAAGWLLLPALAVFVARRLAVGLGSDKLTGGFGAPLDVLVALYQDLADYGLLTGVPLPFAFVDLPVLEAWRPLGWLLVVGVVGGVAGALTLALRRATRAGGTLPGHVVFQALGLVIVLAGLLPVAWADLSLRRRYGFAPSAGVVLIAAAWLELLWRRRPRIAAGILAALLVAGAVGTVARNALYSRAGEVTRALYDEAQSVPAAQRDLVDPVVLVTLPRAYGGDSLRGAYLLHRTDLLSLLWLAGIYQDEPQYALATYYADDYDARVIPAADGGLELEVGFRSHAAFRAALERDPDEDRRGDLVAARRVASDERHRTVRYKLGLRPPLAAHRWLLYSDGKFRPLTLSTADDER